IEICASGDVRLGTASPPPKLHGIGPLLSGPSFPAAQMGPNDLAVFENNGNANMTLLGGAGAFLSTLRFTYSGATSYGYVRYFHDTNDLVLGTSSTDRVRITSAGLVGFGVVPTQPLQHSNGAFLSVGGAWTNASSRDLKKNKEIGGRAEVPPPEHCGRGSLSPPPLVARSRDALVAQVANHRRNIEVIAEIARRHGTEAAAAVGRLRKSLAKKGWIVNLSFRADLLWRRLGRLHLVRL